MLLSLCLLSCKDNKENNNDNNDQEGNEPIVYNLSFSEEIIELTVGEDATYNLVTNISNMDSITIEVDDERFVSVNGNIIHGNRAGETYLRAFYQNLEASVKIQVNMPVVYTVYEKEYWINLVSNPDEILMDKDAIDSFNRDVYSDYSKTKVYDLLSLNTKVSKDYVLSMINEYNSMSSQTVYNNETKTQINSSEKQEILNNRNLEALNSEIEASYAIITSFSRMRSYPTDYYASSYDFDKFQETGLDVGEGILVYHYSKDKEWCFVQSYNYHGWIRSNEMAICDKDMFTLFYNPISFVILLKEHLIINGCYLRMGDKLPYVLNDDEIVIQLPMRDSDNHLKVLYVTGYSEYFHIGYLDYTYQNLYSVAFTLLNTSYRWGDYASDGRDCSSTTKAIYTCFGFVMPRNGSNQRDIPNHGNKFSSGLSEEELKTYPIGSLIFTSGHVMMYIGVGKDGNAYLLHNSGFCKVQMATNYGLGSKIVGNLKFR